MYVYNLQLYEVIVFVPSGMENFLLQSLGCTLTDELEPGARQKVVAVSPAAQKEVFYYQLEILKLKISVIIREKETESLEVKGRRGWLFFLFPYHGDPATKHLHKLVIEDLYIEAMKGH